MVPMALFCSCVPSVFGTAGAVFLYQLLVILPMNRARKQILLESTAEHLTEPEIEKQLALKFPKLYNIKLYSGFIFLVLLIGIYIVSAIVLSLLFASTSVQVNGVNL